MVSQSSGVITEGCILISRPLWPSVQIYEPMGAIPIQTTHLEVPVSTLMLDCNVRSNLEIMPVGLASKRDTFYMDTF